MKIRLIFLIVLFLSATILQASTAKDLSGADSFRLEIDPLIGGGEAALHTMYVINRDGKIFKIANQFDTADKGVLIKKVRPEEINVLIKALEKADIWNINTGKPAHSGKKWNITINGKTKTVYFTLVPEKLKPAFEIVERLITVPSGKPAKK